MASRFVPFLDLDLTAHDIQTLNDADALVAFFSRLGYHTNARIIQAAANLGMVAEVVVKPIRRIERIANHEDALQVYLFEVASVTATHTRALARAFRNLVGNYLLVLTSDYESVDFVLLERYVPKEQTQGLGQRQVGIRPRVLTVDRRKPSRLQLRVLRRFTWTEPDPFFQYDKLLAAYAVADWSEEFFNNRALFSDYYLKERLPLSAEWSDDPKPSYIQLRDLYLGAPERFAGQKKLMLRDLVEPVLRALGFEAKPEKNGARSVIEPDYRLFSSSGSESPIAQCLVYPWGRSLDGKDDRDQETKTENPGAVVVSLLERDGAPWVIVTNGNLWRLYSQRTHSRATNYYEIDLNEMLAESGPQAASPGESFRYFWLLFRRRALEPAEIQREGKTVRLSFLDRLLLESEDYAKELGDRLKDRVFEQIFPHLAAGFIQHLRQNGESNLSQPVLDRIFEGTLTLLYRLLFLLYAESRDLLPVREFRGYFEASLTNLKKIIADAAGTIVDEVGTHLKKHYRDDSYGLYERLSRLFQIIDKGDAALNVPVYNGGLFLSDPVSDDTSPEAKASRFLQSTKVPDRFLAHAIDLLARDVDSKRHDLISIDYKSLGVRQLGSIYEGLLEFKP